MIRKLAFALALVNFGFSGLTHALGLGEVDVTSSLNQPLRAEIELVSTKGLQDTEILPGLATREEFLKAGVDRVYFLSDLRFKVERNAQGNLVVILTTNKPVREPFLNFLVEVIWPSGRLLREYALLIDPPLFAEEPAAPVAAPVIQPRAQEASGDRIAIPAPVATSVTRSAVAPGTYGATNSRDTLWDIATEVRPNRSVSHQQVMLAIQDLNPSAFIGNNINRLKAGQVLRIPTLDQIKERSAARAIEQVIAQNQALNPKKSKSMVSAAKSAPAVSKSAGGSSGNELKLVVADNASSASSAANSGGETENGSGVESDSKLSVTLEKLDKSTLENKELSGRVEDLEEQLATLQRLLTLKNDQLSGLQAQARATEMASLEAEQESEAAAVESADGVNEAMAESDASKEAGVVAEDAMVEDEAVDAESVVADEEVAEEAAPISADAAVGDQSTADTAVAEDNVAVAPEETVTTESLFEQLKNNPLYQGIAAIGLLVLLLILWLVSKQNAKAERDAQSRDAVQPVDADDEPAFEEEHFDTTEENSFDEQDEVANADLDEHLEETEESEPAGEAAEEDVIAESDVYIAYGRLDQAVSVLEQGISTDPVRADYRLKLLEVYAELGDESAFDRQMSELEAIQDPEAMERALEIKEGMSVAEDVVAEPEEELELGETHFEQEHAEADKDSGEPDNSFDFESVSLDDEDDEDLGIDLSSEDLELDLDIDLDADSVDSADAESDLIEYESTESALEDQVDEVSDSVDSASLESDSSVEDALEIDADTLALEDDGDDVALDLALGDIELSDELEQESEIELPEDLSLPDELLGLEGDSSDESVAESVEPSAEDLALDDGDLESADGSEAVAVEGAADSLPQEESIVSDDILDEAVEALGDADDFEADLGDDEDFDFLNGTDEASTKLDLARAYIDMGDVDGARDILLEVEKEGSSEQQADAKSLLGSLD